MSICSGKGEDYSMQYAGNSSDVSAPVALKVAKQHRRQVRASAVRACIWQQDVTAGVKRILQNIPNKVVHFNIHT